MIQPPPPYTSLVDVLRHWATLCPDRTAYVFLLDGDAAEQRITYRELDERARAIAVALRRRVPAGERAMLAYAPGIDFIAAFLGCLYGGIVAVPTYPPDPTRLAKSLPRFRAIAEDARPAAILTTAPLLALAEFLLEQAPELKALPWITTDDVDLAACSDWAPPGVGEGALAFLQYTSGSTGAPKGVMLSHGNLLQNEEAIRVAMGHSESTVVVGWLPLYHDMGLIGNTVQPLYLGIPATLMSPVDFLKKPFAWLKAISSHRATTSGAPNFAYDLCVRKVSQEERATLDLSSWRVAYNGAEPIRFDTMHRFSDAFASCGFDRRAFFPCYGLAESSLIVSGRRSPVALAVDARRLGGNRAAPAERGCVETLTLASSGRPVSGARVVVVAPESCRPLGEDEVGEIWVAGPSVALGYWNRPEESQQTFGGVVADSEEGPFLRTGDLGFLHGGELFVTGRKKDLIIIGGENRYPSDIEQTVAACHHGFRPGCCAAFSVERHGQERLVIVQEVDRRHHDRRQPRGSTPPSPLERRRAADRRQGDESLGVEPTSRGAFSETEAAKAVVAAVIEAHDIRPAAIVFIKPGTIAKTSSGKLQRSACKAEYLAGALEMIAQWQDSEAGPPPTKRGAPMDASAFEAWLVERIATNLGLPTDRIDPTQSFPMLGVDSREALGLLGDLERRFGIRLEPSVMWKHQNIRDLAGFLAAPLEAPPEAPPPAAPAPPAAAAGRAAGATPDAAEPNANIDDLNLFDVLVQGRALRLAERVAHVTKQMASATQGESALVMRQVLSAADREVVILDPSTQQPRSMLMFGSNNYLGLANHPYVRERVRQTVDEFGVGTPGPPHFNGYTRLHIEVEQRLAALKGTEDAVLFSSGYNANVGVVTGLVVDRDVVLCDKLVHASIWDGIRMSGIKSAYTFRHNDVHDLLAVHERTSPAEDGGDTLVIVDGVYSMDGDIAPLDLMVPFCRRRGAMLIVDDAHGTGVLGPTGRGTAEHLGVLGQVDITTATLGKSFGTLGGVACASKPLCQYLRLLARSYMFSTALPPALLAAVAAGLDLLEREPGLREQLWKNIRQTVSGLRELGHPVHGQSAIIVLRTPAAMDVHKAAAHFQKRGIFINYAPYPAVPINEQRFRISIMANHTEEDIRRLLTTVEEVWTLFGQAER